MEKNLDKYITLTDAVKQVTITAEMIHSLVITNRIPFFNDRGTIKVAPADVVEVLDELIGNSIKKARQSIKVREKGKKLFPPEPPAREGETPAEEI